jgi:hypothetical protein
MVAFRARDVLVVLTAEGLEPYSFLESTVIQDLACMFAYFQQNYIQIIIMQELLEFKHQQSGMLYANTGPLNAINLTSTFGIQTRFCHGTSSFPDNVFMTKPTKTLQRRNLFAQTRFVGGSHNTCHDTADRMSTALQNRLLLPPFRNIRCFSFV